MAQRLEEQEVGHGRNVKRDKHLSDDHGQPRVPSAAHEGGTCPVECATRLTSSWARYDRERSTEGRTRSG